MDSSFDHGQSGPKKSFFTKPSFGSIAEKVTANLRGANTANTKDKLKEMEDQNFDLQGNDTDLIDLETNPIQYTASFKTSEDTTPSLTKTESSGPSKTSFTTANGDGLTFDPFSLNIFDEI